MSTKFVSKNSNYMIVLRPGVEGNRNLGTHAVPGLYVKFQAGIADIKEEAVADQMRAHPSFGRDFVEVKDTETDPYADVRQEIEPAHSTTEIVYGHAGKKAGTQKVKLTPQMKKVIEAEAIKMLPSLLKSNPELLKDVLRSLAEEMRQSAPDKQETPKTE